MIKELKAEASKLIILYAEDEDIAGNEMTTLLNKFFSKVLVATNGKEALDIFKLNHNSIDIVITDISMPYMNGLDFLKETKKIKPEQSKIVISAHNDIDNLIKAIEIGVDSFLIKPIERASLVEALYKISKRINIEKEAKLIQGVYVDALTGLPNRFKLMQDMENHSMGALFLADIDGFREINGFYGNPIGDFIIKETAVRLQNEFTASIYYIYRIQSDVYAIAFDGSILDSDIESMESNILSIFAKSYIFDDLEINISVSIGIAIGSTGITLFENAHRALKKAKEKKKNFLVYDETLDDLKEYESNILWSKKIKDALEDNRIVPFFQPIFNNRTNRIEKFESLVRLIEVDGKVISPYYFLDISKKSKLYPSITRAVFQKSFETFKTLPFEFSVNLSTQDITNPDIVDFIITEIKKDCNTASKIVFEIVESESVENYDDIAKFIKVVKAYGVKIAIDDFGSGYSNFMHILKLDPDYLKIDGSIIKSAFNKDGHAVIEAIRYFAQKIGLKTIAEFVSSIELQNKVVELDIDYSQGYLIGEPKQIVITS